MVCLMSIHCRYSRVLVLVACPDPSSVRELNRKEQHYLVKQLGRKEKAGLSSKGTSLEEIVQIVFLIVTFSGSREE